MKTKQIIFPLIAFAALYLSACQKDFTIEDNGNVIVDTINNPLAGDSVYLDKIIIRDTSFLSGTAILDSSQWVFKYDVQKRLNQVALKSFINSNEGFILFKFYYNLDDSLPFKVDNNTVLGTVPGTTGLETHYFFYNNLGKLIKDSINNFSGVGEILVKTFSYSGNKIFAELNNSFYSVNPVGKDTFILDSRMNIVDFRYYIRTTANTFELASSSTNVYDNGTSPFVKVPSFKIYWFIFSTVDFEASTSLYPGVNNVLNNTYYRYPFTGSSSGVTPVQTYFQTNTYYPNGLLKNFRNSEHENWTYFYKSL